MHTNSGDYSDPLCDLWQAALDAEVGVGIETDNRGLLRQHLYRARAEANNPEFDKVIMIMPENEGELWLVKKDAGSSGAFNKGNLKLIR